MDIFRINNNYSNINFNTNVCKLVKNINIIRDVSAKNSNKHVNKCTGELLASEALRISMKERFKESTKAPAFKELQKSMKLLVLLLLDTSIKKGKVLSDNSCITELIFRFAKCEQDPQYFSPASHGSSTTGPQPCRPAS